MNQTNIAMLAIFVAVGAMYMPQTIGSVNAQSQQGSAHACPTGFTLSHGRCIAPVSFGCPTGTGFIFSLNGTKCNAAINTPFMTRAQVLKDACVALGGTSSVADLGPGAGFRVTCSIPAIATCPGGITPTGGQCITRPGQGNRP